MLHCIFALESGGAETQLRLLSNHMAHNRTETAIFFVKGKPDSKSKVKYYQCEQSRYPWFLIKVISSAIKDFKPDVIQAWLPAPINVATLIAGKINSVPVISSIRNRSQVNNMQRFISYLFTLTLASRIITNNPISQSSTAYQFLFKKLKGVEIRNAICASFLSKDKPLIKDNKQFTILFAGRLTEQKNPSLLIKALSLLDKPILENIALNICGVGEQEQKLKNLTVSNRLESNVRFHGYKKDLKSFFLKSHLLVLPSIYEGMPNVVVEAMSMQVPTLISDIEVHKTLFCSGECVFFANNDCLSLAKSIEKFYRQQVNISKMQEKADEFVAKCSIKHVADQYLEAYEATIYQNNIRTIGNQAH